MRLVIPYRHADETHRSQYDFIDGFAKHIRDALPKASFIGFTGTPIESGDKDTQAVFGDLGGVPTNWNGSTFPRPLLAAEQRTAIAHGATVGNGVKGI